jgi:hypothetical protein
MSGSDAPDKLAMIRRIDEKGDQVAKLYVRIINLGEQLKQALRSADGLAGIDSEIDNLTDRFEIVIDGILSKKDNLLKIKERLDVIEQSQTERIGKKKRLPKPPI